MKPKPLSVMRLMVPVVDIVSPLEKWPKLAVSFLVSSHTSRSEAAGPWSGSPARTLEVKEELLRWSSS